MELLIEKSVCTNQRCYACGALVYDVEKKKTANHIYHNRCFCCRICKRNLTASSLNEEGDDIYCENCYRKKQRGDCLSVGFQRAAAERGQYVYNHRHPDQPSPKSNPRRPILRDLAQNPSWTLRQLELQFLAREQPTTVSAQRGTSNELQRFRSLSPPMSRKRTYTSPARFVKSPQRPSTATYPSSTSLRDLATLASPSGQSRVAVPSLEERTALNRRVKFADVVFDTMKTRVNQRYADLKKDVSTFVERRKSMGDDGKENDRTHPSRPRFRAVANTVSGGRSLSTNNDRSPGKIN